MSGSSDITRPKFKLEWRFDLDPPVADSEMVLLRRAVDEAFGQRHLPLTRREFLGAALKLPNPRGLLDAVRADRRRKDAALGRYQDRLPEDLER